MLKLLGSSIERWITSKINKQSNISKRKLKILTIIHRNKIQTN